MSNLLNIITAAEEKLAAIKKDAEALENKGNKAAGTRTRTGAMDLIRLMKDVRVQVTEIKTAPKA